MTRRRVAAWLAGTLVLLLLAAVVALSLLLQPQRLSRLALDTVGGILGLEISASGEARYRLRGTPMLEVRDVVARQPGAATPLLRAERVFLSLPWSTLRNRAAPLELDRIELDAPRLDVAALQAWLATRPPGDGRIPTLRNGLLVNDGRIDGDGWHVEGFGLSLQALRAGAPLAAKARGRLVLASPTTVEFDLRTAAERVENGSGAAVTGHATLDNGSWRLPAYLTASGPLRYDAGILRLQPLRFGASARYEGGDTSLPFTLGLHGPLRLRDGAWSLAPADVVLHGEGVVPDLDARGRIALSRALLLGLSGHMAEWPQAWPTLPPPLDAPGAPLPFSIAYAGAPTLADPVALQLAHGDARADAVFRIADVLGWSQDAANGSPLPPLRARASAPRIEVPGGVLEGVEVTIEESP
ncbi:hypothetical protein [Luteimonas sp. MC1825]|uniref:hypothetical protein n=1 Tax=Luteimonas sp. MC1825 TaxID=2761107 RepID=UPI001620AEFD|nr:hypothetical protein [Luteimonas sp. MC1825]MBB6599093.1 hypothetical protein [Luteimonas sp. MC1825]QOC89219.1 hypothetical protein IDM46_05765 [Luteimonas sp. MC1825]